MAVNEHQPGEPAPGTGVYEELNIFGSPTGRVTAVAKDEALPASARGFSWRPLMENSVSELRVRAAEHRRMAAVARTAAVADSLRALADRFDAFADQREREERGRS